MAARHYNIEISTDDGASWSLARGNEAPGPGKSLVVSGLAAGGYLVRLRLIALSGDPTPVVSDQVLLQVGPVISEELLSTAEAVTTVADLLSLQEQLLSSAGVEVSAETLQVMAEQVVAAAQGAATVSDALVYAEQLVAAVEAQASAADLQAMAEQLVTAVAVEAGVVDVQTGVVIEAVESPAEGVATVLDTAAIAEQLVAAVEVQASAADVQAMAEQLVAAAAGVALVSDGAVRSEAVASAGEVVATAAALQVMLEGVAAVVTAQATAADGAIRMDAAVAAAEVVASVADVFVPGAAPPAQVTGLTVVNTTPQLLVTWSDVSGETYYELFYSISAALTAEHADGVSGGYPAAPDATAGKFVLASGVTQRTINGSLTAGVTYYVRVRALNGEGAGLLSAAAAAAAAEYVPGPEVFEFEVDLSSTMGTLVISSEDNGGNGTDAEWFRSMEQAAYGSYSLKAVTGTYDDGEGELGGTALFVDLLGVDTGDGPVSLMCFGNSLYTFVSVEVDGVEAGIVTDLGDSTWRELVTSNIVAGTHDIRIVMANPGAGAWIYIDSLKVPLP